MNWYKIAKIGEQYLKAIGVPEQELLTFANYLDQFPDNIQKYLVKQFKKFIETNKRPMSFEEFKSIPIEMQNQPTQIDQEMEQIITNIANTKEEREWLRKLVTTGRFKKEDTVKLQTMLKQLNSLQQDNQIDINQFQDDTELAAYLQQFQQSQITQLPESGWQLLEDYNYKNKNIKMYRITNQEALDAIGGNANWCVLSDNGKYEYTPFEYYAFIIDGQPEVLVHEGSAQIKDSNDAIISDVDTIKAIVPMIKKYDFDNPEKQISEDVQEDFEELEAKIENIKRVEDLNENNPEELRSDLEYDPEQMLFIPKKDWGKYVDIVIKNMDKIYLSLMSYDALEYIASYAKASNNIDKFKILQDKVIFSLTEYSLLLNMAQYHKTVPPSLRNKETNKIALALSSSQRHPEKTPLTEEDWIHLLTTYPNSKRIEYKAPEHIKAMKEVKIGIKNGWRNLIRNNPKLIEGCPYSRFAKDQKLWTEILTDPKTMYKGWNTYPFHLNRKIPSLQAWKALIEKRKEEIPKGLDDYDNMSEIHDTLNLVWRKLIGFDPDGWEVANETDYLSNPVVKLLISEWEKTLREDPIKLYRAPEELQPIIKKELEKAA